MKQWDKQIEKQQQITTFKSYNIGQIKIYARGLDTVFVVPSNQLNFTHWQLTLATSRMIMLTEQL
jgi:hypothetical protein